MEDYNEEPVEQHIVIAHDNPQKNSLGTAGFVVALVDFVFCWAPVLNFLLWIVGLVLSAVGMFRKPKGFAIAGFWISVLNLAMIVLTIKGMVSLMDYLME